MNSFVHWIEANPQWVAIFVYTLLEAWLGKTEKVQSGSVIQLIWNIFTRRKL
jgi:hypothetical protein